MGRTTERTQGILLIGPTGAGKTPLGEALETSGIAGRRWFHFDFGAHLREAARQPEKYSFLGEADVRTIRSSLETGALLEDDQFHIVASLFSSFKVIRGMTDDDTVVLNGIPRHAGQAARLADYVDVVKVVQLDCDEETVVRRIRNNSGGDRTHRIDDDTAAVIRKCRTFRERTLPLLSFYRDLAVDIVVTVSVGEDTQPGEIVEKISGSIETCLIL